MRPRTVRTALRATAAAAALALAALTAGPAAAAPATPFTTPNTQSCPYRMTPPPAVDKSEVPSPGETVPKPVPVPAHAVGGPQLRDCGAIQAAGTPPLPGDISAAGWVLADLDTGQVLAAKDPHGRHRPASTIKTLLSLVALKNLDLNTVVTGTQADANADGSRVGIGAGGRYSDMQLMQGLLMNSGNDAAHALAAQMGGGEATVAKMNALAKDLGALDTRTATTCGLDGPGMSTSAYDLALFFRDAMRNPTFAQLVSAGPVMFPGYPANPQIPGDKPHPGFMIANDNPLLTGYPGAIGGKTGYTDDAHQTYIGAAQRDGRRLVVTYMDGTRKPIDPWKQAAHLLDWGFAQPQEQGVGTLVEPGTVSTDAPVETAQPPAAHAGGAAVNAAAPQSSQAILSWRYAVILVGGVVVLGLLLTARKLWRRGR